MISPFFVYIHIYINIFSKAAVRPRSLFCCVKGGETMAKSKYETHVQDKLILIEGWARDGLTEAQIAKNLGISIDTFYTYKKKYSEFFEVLKRGKEVADYEVENALHKAAVNGNVTAMIFWLKNRKPQAWKDRKEAQEIELAKRDQELKEKKFELERKKLESGEKEEMVININITGDNDAT
jgi:hypothetical protein